MGTPIQDKWGSETFQRRYEVQSTPYRQTNHWTAQRLMEVADMNMTYHLTIDMSAGEDRTAVNVVRRGGPGLQRLREAARELEIQQERSMYAHDVATRNYVDQTIRTEQRVVRLDQNGRFPDDMGQNVLHLQNEAHTAILQPLQVSAEGMGFVMDVQYNNDMIRRAFGL